MSPLLAIIPVSAYLIGSIPFGFIAGKLNGIDIRKHGSGNPGATNVMRVIGKPAGIIVLALDIAKGFLPVFFLAPYIYAITASSEELTDRPLAVLFTLACGLAVILGHVFTIFLKFRGGKGVATSIGVILALSYTAGLCAVGVWAVTVALTRYVSLGSILGAISLPAWLILWSPRPFEPSGELYILIFSAVVALLVIIRHSSNIKRLITGNENKLGQRKESRQNENKDSDNR